VAIKQLIMKKQTKIILNILGGDNAIQSEHLLVGFTSTMVFLVLVLYSNYRSKMHHFSAQKITVNNSTKGPWDISKILPHRHHQNNYI